MRMRTKRQITLTPTLSRSTGRGGKKTMFNPKLTSAILLTTAAMVAAQDAASHPRRGDGLQYSMQSYGGSLLQASMPDANDNPHAGPSYNLYAVPEPEPKVLKKHDLVNIIVREESQSQTKGTTDLKKNADLDAKVDSFVKFNPAAFAIMGQTFKNPPEIKMEGNRDYKGDGSVDRTDTITARIEAEVLDVKPNGTLVIQARKHIKTDDEEQTIVLTGICRVQDVDADNSVVSTNLHDLELKKETKGAVRDTNKRGLIPSLLDFINPF